MRVIMASLDRFGSKTELMCIIKKTYFMPELLEFLKSCFERYL